MAAAASMISSGVTAVVGGVSAPVHAAATRSSLTPMLPPATTNKLELRSKKIKSQLQCTTATTNHADQGRRGALVGGLAALLFASSISSGSANAGVIDEYLEKSKANKELNDKKRLATSGANFARAYTVQFGSCKFPENFTGCQDLAKQKKVQFLSDDLKLECEGKDKYKCGSDVFWKW